MSASLSSSCIQEIYFVQTSENNFFNSKRTITMFMFVCPTVCLMFFALTDFVMLTSLFFNVFYLLLCTISNEILVFTNTHVIYAYILYTYIPKFHHFFTYVSKPSIKEEYFHKKRRINDRPANKNSYIRCT